MAGRLFDVSVLKSTLGGGAKTDKFTIEFGAPTGNSALNLGETGAVLCKTASFPQMKLGGVEVYAQGRALVVPGETQFDNTWTLDFYQTVDHKLRQMFIEWLRGIDDFSTNNHTCTPADWMVDAVVYQLGCNGEPTAKYRFFNMFPDTISEVRVDGSQLNAIQEFSVSFHFSHWLPEAI